MPRSWHDRYSAIKIEDEDKSDLYRTIVADKKPYFMRYIYPAVMKQYNTYVKCTNKNSLRRFGVPVSEMMSSDESLLSEEQKEFIKYYKLRMPLGMNDCVMNKICRRIEEAFDKRVSAQPKAELFDYSIMRNNKVYSQKQYYDIKKEYIEYNHRLKNFEALSSYENADELSSFEELKSINDEFIRECTAICPNADVLCQIVLDLCYTKMSTKKFAWSMCGDEIIDNLLKNNKNTIEYPVLDPDGDIMFGGEKFKMHTNTIGGETEC